MKYILLGTISEQWAAKHAERVTRAKANCKSSGSRYYTQGAFDFVDVVEAPDPEAALAFSLWYAKEGHGRIPDPARVRFRNDGTCDEESQVHRLC